MMRAAMTDGRNREIRCAQRVMAAVAALMMAVVAVGPSPSHASDAAVAEPAAQLSDAERSVAVAKTASCGCCSAWVTHMRSAGFEVAAENMAMGQLMRFKTTHGIRPEHASCHTARVGGYTIEGHVPAGDVVRLLKERPDAVGLTVPGMPIGSPGMEVGDRRDAYEVLLVLKDGGTRVFSSYSEKQ